MGVDTKNTTIETTLRLLFQREFRTSLSCLKDSTNPRTRLAMRPPVINIDLHRNGLGISITSSFHAFTAPHMHTESRIHDSIFLYSWITTISYKRSHEFRSNSPHLTTARGTPTTPILPSLLTVSSLLTQSFYLLNSMKSRLLRIFRIIMPDLNRMQRVFAQFILHSWTFSSFSDSASPRVCIQTDIVEINRPETLL